ncbi:hypothetical protein [Streptomyces sp. NRRL S-244]|uniref:hypothetical protein n=1 Tax=Streptomyces sp. NRRL S-244 TaxID=1463897 RepID=UPI00068E14C1|nr:hypothetical protein [Streptomyces sp. NRRL S-244]
MSGPGPRKAAGEAADHPADRARKIADRLDGLIARETERTGGRAPAYRELAERINTLAGRDVISKDTIRNLHHGVNQKGQAPNPTVDTLDWLGRGFGIQAGAGYFLDDMKAAAVDDQLARLDKISGLRQALDNSEVVGLVQRASGLSDSSLNMLVALADKLVQLEQEAKPPS